jgi:hypothetical protein
VCRVRVVPFVDDETRALADHADGQRKFHSEKSGFGKSQCALAACTLLKAWEKIWTSGNPKRFIDLQEFDKRDRLAVEESKGISGAGPKNPVALWPFDDSLPGQPHRPNKVIQGRKGLRYCLPDLLDDYAPPQGTIRRQILILRRHTGNIGHRERHLACRDIWR